MFILSLTEVHVNTVATCNIYNQFLHLFDIGRVQVLQVFEDSLFQYHWGLYTIQGTSNLGKITLVAIWY